MNRKEAIIQSVLSAVHRDRNNEIAVMQEGDYELVIYQYSPIGDRYQFSAPSTIQLEITNACQEKCRHCYNFWRQDDFRADRIRKEQFDLFLQEAIKNKVFHLILTGGEPLLNFDLLLYAVKPVVTGGLSVSLNSNLMAATPEKMSALKEAGLPHVLTSLNSHKPDINDFMVNVEGAYQKILTGIRTTIEAGILVSTNMIISETNIDDIFETAKLAKELGVVKFHATRTVPPIKEGTNFRKEFEVGQQEARRILSELTQVEEKLDLLTGALVSFPHCFLGNLPKHRSLLMRGCAAGSKLMAINYNGDAHACVYEMNNYGNIFKIGIKQCWDNMQQWRTGELIPKDCLTCSLFDYCDAGCRLMGLAYTGGLDGDDNLKIAKINVPNSPHIDYLRLRIKDKAAAASEVRWRQENGFVAVNLFGAETFIGRWRKKVE